MKLRPARAARGRRDETQVLKLGNKLNDGGATARGFSLESLLKLNTSKAFDKQTSILQYVIVVMKRLEAKDAPASPRPRPWAAPRPRGCQWSWRRGSCRTRW